MFEETVSQRFCNSGFWQKLLGIGDSVILSRNDRTTFFDRCRNP